jgi:hypothetical protein
MSDYLWICGSQHGIIATGGGTPSERFCVGLFCRNVFWRFVSAASFGPEMGLSWVFWVDPFFCGAARRSMPLCRFVFIPFLLQKHLCDANFSSALDTDKFEGGLLAFFIDFSLVKNAFSNFH